MVLRHFQWPRFNHHHILFDLIHRLLEVPLPDSAPLLLVLIKCLYFLQPIPASIIEDLLHVTSRLLSLESPSLPILHHLLRAFSLHTALMPIIYRHVLAKLISRVIQVRQGSTESTEKYLSHPLPLEVISNCMSDYLVVLLENNLLTRLADNPT